MHALFLIVSVKGREKEILLKEVSQIRTIFFPQITVSPFGRESLKSSKGDELVYTSSNKKVNVDVKLSKPIEDRSQIDHFLSHQFDNQKLVDCSIDDAGNLFKEKADFLLKKFGFMFDMDLDSNLISIKDVLNYFNQTEVKEVWNENEAFEVSESDIVSSPASPRRRFELNLKV